MAKTNKIKYETQVRLRKIDLIDSFIRSIPWLSSVAIVYFIAQSISSLAGKHTIADIGISFLANISVSEAVGYIFGAYGFTYGVAQRRLRRNTVQRLTDRIAKYEQRSDPERSSSKLTEHGTTRPEDKK